MSVFSTEFSAKIKWQLARTFDRIGLLGRIALLAILFSLILFFLRSEVLQHKIVNLRAVVPNAIQGSDTYVDQAKMLEVSLTQFPTVSDKAQIFNKFMHIAKTHELFLDAVTYKTKRVENTAPFSQTTVDFTLYATYPEVHDFMNTIMVEMPFVAIEQLSFIRANNEDEVIEARIKLLFNFVLN